MDKDGKSHVTASFSKQILIENIGLDTNAEDLEKCFKNALKDCSSQTKPVIHVAVDKKGRSLGYAMTTVPITKVDLFLNYNGWYVNKHQMKVSMSDAHDMRSTWHTSNKGVFMASPTTISTVVNSSVKRYCLVDGGVYLTSRKFKTPEEVISKAINAGVERLVSLGTSIYHSQEGLKLARLFTGRVYCTAGVNPQNAVFWTDEAEAQLEEVARCSECVAVGPCGFDLSSDQFITTCDQQMQAFDKQLQLACRLDKPVVVTDNQASTEVMSLLNKYKGQLSRVAVLGRPVDMDTFTQYLQEGYYYFVSGEVLEKEPPGILWRWIKNLPDFPWTNQLLLASLAPFFKSPAKGAGSKDDNGPEKLVDVVEFLDEHFSLGKTELGRIMKENAELFYWSSREKCEGPFDSNPVQSKDRDSSEVDTTEEISADNKNRKSADDTHDNGADDTHDNGADDTKRIGEEGSKPTGVLENKKDSFDNLQKSDSKERNEGMKTDEYVPVTKESITQKCENFSSETEFTSARQEGSHGNEAGGNETEKADDRGKRSRLSEISKSGKDSPETNWTYRLVLWCAFICGLLAMYFYDF